MVNSHLGLKFHTVYNKEIINDLAQEISVLESGIKIGEKVESILVYVDDNTQKQLDIWTDWGR